MRVLLQPNRHVVVAVHSASVEYFGRPILAGKNCFTFMLRSIFRCLKSIRFPALECRIWNSICVTKVLHGQGIFWYDDFALTNLLEPSIFACQHVRATRIEFWILLGFSHGVNVEKLSLVISPALFFLAFLRVVKYT